VEATDHTLTYTFVNRKGQTVDTYAQCRQVGGGVVTRQCLAPVWGGRSR
jgi:hypothetical protein